MSVGGGGVGLSTVLTSRLFAQSDFSQQNFHGLVQNRGSEPDRLIIDCICMSNNRNGEVAPVALVTKVNFRLPANT